MLIKKSTFEKPSVIYQLWQKLAWKELLRHDNIFFAYRFFHDYNEECVSHHSRFSVFMYLKRIMLLLHYIFLRSIWNKQDMKYFKREKSIRHLLLNMKLWAIRVSFYFKIRDNYVRQVTVFSFFECYWNILFEKRNIS